MARKGHSKTATITLRVEPQLKALAERAAEQDHRSLTGFVEVLILKHCKTLGLQPDSAGDEKNGKG